MSDNTYTHWDHFIAAQDKWIASLENHIRNLEGDTDWHKRAAKVRNQEQMLYIMGLAVLRDDIDFGDEWETQARILINSQPKYLEEWQVVIAEDDQLTFVYFEGDRDDLGKHVDDSANIVEMHGREGHIHDPDRQ